MKTRVQVFALTALLFATIYVQGKPVSVDISDERAAANATDTLTNHLKAISAAPRVIGRFTEVRYYQFRKTPKELSGVFRKNEYGSLSLAYDSPRAVAIHVTPERSLFYKNEVGRIRDLSKRGDASSEAELLYALFHLDFEFLRSLYDMKVSGSQSSWKVGFHYNEQKGKEKQRFDHVLISGDDLQVRKIFLKRGKSRSIEIQVDDVIFPEFFLQGDYEDFFFVE